MNTFDGGVRVAPFVMDAHLDLAYDVELRRRLGDRRVVAERYLPGFRRGGVDAVISSLFISNTFLPEMALRKALEQISALRADLEETDGAVCLCRSVEDLLAAQRRGAVGVLLSFEGAEPLQGRLELLRIFFELGVRGVGLVWSRRNEVGDGCHFFPETEGRPGGLTPFGVELVAAVEDMGMFVDVSHLNDAGFEDVARFARKPFLASHSNCRALVPVARNLTDDQIRILGSRGGLTGMNACDVFVSPNPQAESRDLADVLVDHVDHVRKVAGIGAVGLGFDFCDQFRDLLLEGGSIETRDALEGHGELDRFLQALRRRGYGEEEIGAVLGGNLLRFLRGALK